MHGLIQHFRLGHADFFWRLRTEPRVLETFAKIWGVPAEDLLVSFDGGNLSRPSQRQQKGWEHLDQGSANSDLLCVQGCVVLTQCNGGINFYRDSHALHRRFFRHRKSKGNWYKLTEKDKDWYFNRDAKPTTVNAEPGDIILWDSRTVHWGEPPTDQPRLCLYVSYLPRSRANAKQLAKRLDTFAVRRMTSHWAVPVKLFPLTYQHYGHPELLERFPDRPTIRDEDMTPTMWRLVGRE
jgi:hypothetical protein